MSATPSETGSYRPDIDGLRALAVVAVIIYHLNTSWLPGGFVGVDIFFVISGFLITSHILSELREDRFSLLKFYGRRIRRIFPALAAMMAVTTVAALALLLPRELTSFGKSLASAALSGSNIFFWRDSGYFQLASQEQPLLHTWSLGVEEQFYLLFPVLLLFTIKIITRHYAPVIIAGWIVSFGIVLWAIKNGQDIASFFLLPTRAWELLTGAILALGIIRTPQSPVIGNGLALTGLAAMAASQFVISSTTPGLGAWMLLPVLGAALIIHTNQTIVARVLASPAFVFTGLISYSLYLWHWPIFVFSKYYLIHEPGIVAITMMLSGTFALSVLSWKYIERPFRNPQRTYPLGKVFGGFAGINLVFLVVGIFIFKNEGLPQRFSDIVIGFANTERVKDVNMEAFHGGDKLILGVMDKTPHVLIWGDSHASSLVAVLDTLANRHGVSAVMLKQAGCMPYTDITIPQSHFCRNFTPNSVAYLADHPEIHTVVLVSRWSAYPRWWSNTSDSEGTPETREKFSKVFLSTIATLTEQKKRVVIVAEPPLVDYPVASALARMELYGNAFDMTPSVATYQNQQKLNFPLFEQAKNEYGAEIIYLHKAMCGTETCDVMREGQSLYFDGNHLSSYGAMLTAESIDTIFKK